MTKKKEPTAEEAEATRLYVEAVDLFTKDPAELADDPAALEKIIAYLRATRENVAAAEKAGRKITKKSANTKVTDDRPANPLDRLAT